MRLVVNGDEDSRCDFALLTSIDGVGPITAMTVLAEIGDLRRFERARQLTAYAGVSPRVVLSGTSVHGKTRMCKRGNARVRQALYLSAMATLNTKHPNTLSTMHYRLCEEGKEGKAALGAVMRKLRLPPIFDHGTASLRWNLRFPAPCPGGQRAACP